MNKTRQSSTGLSTGKTCSPTTLFVTPLCVLFLLIITTFAQAQESQGATEPGLAKSAGGEITLLKISGQDLSTLEPVVAEQLQLSRELVDTLVAKDEHGLELADAFGELGKLYHAYELFESAEVCYINAGRIDANQFQWSYYLAHLYNDNGRPLEALQLYQQMESIHPEPVLIRIRIGDTYQALGRLAEARQSFLQAFYLRPESSTVLARLGELAVEEKQYQTAITFLGAALASQPEANRLHYPLAMAYRGLGNTEQATNHLRQRGSVGIQPRDPWISDLKNLLQGERSYLISGKLAYSAGRFDESIEAFRTALTFNKDSASAHINLGTALSETGQTEEAMVHFLTALALEPENLTAHYNLGFLYLKTGKAGDAIPHLEKVAATSDEDANAHQLLAQALEMNLQFEEAMEVYRQTVLIEPSTENAWMGGVRLLLQNRDYTKALGVLNQAHDVLPNSGRITHALAKLLAASPDGSIRDGQKAVSLALAVFQADPTAGHAQTVAMAYAESGECGEAVKWQQRAIDALANGNEAIESRLLAELEHYQDSEPCRPALEVR